MTSEPSFGDTTRKANRVGAIAKEDKTALVVLLCQKVGQEGIEHPGYRLLGSSFWHAGRWNCSSRNGPGDPVLMTRESVSTQHEEAKTDPQSVWGAIWIDSVELDEDANATAKRWERKQSKEQGNKARKGTTRKGESSKNVKFFEGEAAEERGNKSPPSPSPIPPFWGTLPP